MLLPNAKCVVWSAHSRPQLPARRRHRAPQGLPSLAGLVSLPSRILQGLLDIFGLGRSASRALKITAGTFLQEFVSHPAGLAAGEPNPQVIWAWDAGKPTPSLAAASPSPDPTNPRGRRGPSDRPSCPHTTSRRRTGNSFESPLPGPWAAEMRDTSRRASMSSSWPLPEVRLPSCPQRNAP